jgi:hypothetical protein
MRLVHAFWLWYLSVWGAIALAFGVMILIILLGELYHVATEETSGINDGIGGHDAGGEDGKWHP